MTLVALANVLTGDPMVKRFHADPRVQATELLLQERVPRQAPIAQPRPAEETRKSGPVPALAIRRFRSPHTRFPHAQFLSNGSYTAVVTNAGGGASFCRGRVVTRHREDPTRDPGSQFLYLRDVRSGAVWSATFQPTLKEPEDHLVTFLPEKATFHRRDDDIATQLDIAVSTEDDVEVRRLAVTNHSDRSREIEVTSYAEIVLAPAADDLAHPAFGKLFVETEYLPESAALLCHRRSRGGDEAAAWAVHVLSLEGRTQGPVEWETDRGRFLGRGRGPENPQALDGRSLSGTTGVVLDPVVSLRQRIRLAPGGFVRLSFATGMASTRETALALAQRYHDPSSAARTFALAFAHAQSGLRHLGVSSEQALLFERLASRVLYSDRSLRASPEILARNTLGQEGLWPHGISGDLPILLVRVVEEDDLPLVRQVLQAQEYWRLKGLSADVVILNEHPVSYLDEMHAQLAALLDNGPWRTWKHRPGGAYLLRGDRMPEAERILIASVACAVLSGDRGELASQLDTPDPEWPEAADLVPSREPSPATRPAVDAPVPTLALANGSGGFADDGRDYVIVLEADQETPLPWANVMANPHFGTVVTASGSAYTWSENSRENRLTPFANDPVTDPTAEALFIRDDETGATWSPTPGPIPRTDADGRFVIRHSAGLTRFARVAHGLHHGLDVFVDAQDPVKFSLLTLTNEGPTTRRLSVVAYNEWVLGPPRAGQGTHVVIRARPRHRNDTGPKCLQPGVRGTRGLRPCERGGPLGNGRPVVVPRAERLPRPAGGAPARSPVGPLRGGARSLRRSSRLRHPRPRGHLSPGVPAGTGQGRRGGPRSREAAWSRGGRGRRPSEGPPGMGRHPGHRPDSHPRRFLRPADEPLAALSERELPVVGPIRLLSARRRLRIPRSASGRDGPGPGPAGPLPGAPVASREPAVPGRRRAALVARAEWPGDAHAMLRRPAVAALRGGALRRHHGRPGVLDQPVPFLEGPLLAPDVQDAYGQPHLSAEEAPLFEHCLRAIDRGLTAGVHGLPLMGSGDWNDGMNRVGRGGRGESAWLGFFLHGLLARFAPLCEARGDLSRAERYRSEASRLASMLEQTWDGEWYRRGYYDDGSPLGSAQNDECRIDAIAQSWAVLSGAIPVRFADRAMDAVRTHLIRRGPQVVLLLTPPFDKSTQDPGYIKGYPPGVRENGGQYTHAALWVVMAMARLGSGDEAVELFHLLNPVNHTRNPADVERYKAEPYVVAGDVYAHPAHAGRGGWTWYTGSAGWMYRAGLESILGLRRRGSTFAVAPCVPSSWPEYTLRLALRYHPLRDHGHEPGAPVPRRRRGGAGRRLRGLALHPPHRRRGHPPCANRAGRPQASSSVPHPDGRYHRLVNLA